MERALRSWLDDWEASLWDFAEEARLRSVKGSDKGRWPQFWVSPKKSWAGEKPYSLGVFLQTRRASRNRGRDPSHFLSRDFIDFTALSAKPLDCGK